jgi:hypothetical protein
MKQNKFLAFFAYVDPYYNHPIKNSFFLKTKIYYYSSHLFEIKSVICLLKKISFFIKRILKFCQLSDQLTQIFNNSGQANAYLVI